ncbi:MAG TPA: response regulator [Verrucomicrobiae bacterium]|nr:response regulator [Verrucomicrobiae bacterium]
MIENSHSLLTRFDPLHAGDAEAGWVGPDLVLEQDAVRGKRILLVDDEEPIRLCLRLMLEAEGYHVTEASDGVMALNLFVAGGFDLVITDFQMPVMEGDKLAVGIKLLAPSQPILMITAYERARRNADNPVDILLRKPFTATDLQCALKQLLAARSEPDQPAGISPADSPALALAQNEPIFQLQA